MDTTYRYVFSIIVVVLIICGCSGRGGNPVIPEAGDKLSLDITGGTVDGQEARTVASSQHVPLGVYRLHINHTENTIEVVADRELLAHINATDFLNPPNCSDCFKLKILNWDPDNCLINLLAELKNPFPVVSGYDVRLILDSEINGYRLENPDTGKADGYTELWDIWGETRNPFIAIAKDQPQREAGPLSIHNHIVDLYYPTPPGNFHFKDLLITIDACYPENCPEPYEIVDVLLDTHEINKYGEEVGIQCRVHSWWGDIEGVTVRIEKKGNPELLYTLDLENTVDDIYEGTIELNGEVPVGVCQLWLQTWSSSEPSLYMWQMEEIEILLNDGGWALTWGGTEQDKSHAVVIDEMGNLYIMGFFEDTVDFDPSANEDFRTSIGSRNIFLCKFDLNGNYQWVRTWAASSGKQGYKGLTTDAEGNIFVTGYFSGVVDFDPGSGEDYPISNGGQDLFVSKFNFNGDYQWVYTWGDEYDDRGTGIATDSSGNIYVTGYTWKEGKLWDAILLKLSPGGNPVEEPQIWGGIEDDWGFDIGIDEYDMVYVVGRFEGHVDFDPDPSDSEWGDSVGSTPGFISKFDSGCDFIWVKTWGGYARELDFDYAENIYLVGGYGGTVDFDPGDGVDEHTSNDPLDIFIAKYNLEGEFEWANTWGGNQFCSGPWCYRDIGCALAVSDSGNEIYSTGRFLGEVDFDPGPGKYLLTPTGPCDIYLCRYDSDGNFIWARQWGGNDYYDAPNSHYLMDGGRGVAVDANGNIYVTSRFGNTVDFNPGPGIYERTANGYTDIALSKFFPTGYWE